MDKKNWMNGIHEMRRNTKKNIFNLSKNKIIFIRFLTTQLMYLKCENEVVITIFTYKYGLFIFFLTSYVCFKCSATTSQPAPAPAV